MTPAEKSYTVGPVRITRHFVDWNDVEDCVQRRIAAVEPGSTVYLNPQYTVTAPNNAPVRRFVKQARRHQVLWNQYFRRRFGSAVRRRLVKQADSATRQLVFTGVMILNGRPLHPKGWPDDPRTVVAPSGRPR